MRNYVRGVYGEFHEDNDSLGIHLVLKVWRSNQDDFDNVIQQLKEDVQDAGPDWTGTLAIGPVRRWWTFGPAQEDDRPVIVTLLETWFHGVSQDSGAFSTFMDDQFVSETPRPEGYNSKSEKKRIKASPRLA